MHILIAPNAFKNSLDAREAALAIQKGFDGSRLVCTTECFPVGDGGDGTAQLIVDKFKGSKVNVTVQDPLGRIVKTSFGLIDRGKTAVIEMADASGIRLLNRDELNPLKASSIGTGEMITTALDKGVRRIILGLGGSATVDGGAGLLSALGVKFLDEKGKVLRPQPDALFNLDAIDISGLDRRIFACKIIVLCDVDNTLTGKKGSAAVFGPQKGASAPVVSKLDGLLSHISKVGFTQTHKHMDKIKHGGAAGGVAAALYAFCNAELVNGAEYFLSVTNFEKSLQKAGLVVTGEGSLDVQTLNGKAPFAVAVMAKRAKVPVVGIAGSVPLIKHSKLEDHFNVLLAIGNQPADLTSAIADTKANLIRTGALLGNLFSLPQTK